MKHLMAGSVNQPLKHTESKHSEKIYVIFRTMTPQRMHLLVEITKHVFSIVSIVNGDFLVAHCFSDRP